MRFAPGKRCAKRLQQLVFDAWMIAQQIFPRRNYMFDHFGETTQRLPNFAVGVEAARLAVLFPAKEKLIQQPGRIDFAEVQGGQPPLKSRGRKLGRYKSAT